jgi:uncharacterized membrane protein YhaH (DUF805 family)
MIVDANKMFELLFEPHNDGYLYTAKNRRVFFTTQERDAYVAAYRKASSGWKRLAAFAVFGLVVVAIVVTASLFNGQLPEWTYTILLVPALLVTLLPSLAVSVRLWRDAAGRPAAAPAVSKSESRVRGAQMLPWPMVIAVLAISAVCLISCLTAPTFTLKWWVWTLGSAFLLCGYSLIAYRKIAARNASPKA